MRNRQHHVNYMKAHTNLDTHKGGMIKTTFQSNENFGLSITKMNPG